MQCGLFGEEKAGRDEMLFCVLSDVHIAPDEMDIKDSFHPGSRNDYVFGGKSYTPVSGEAYTLKRFCEKAIASGRSGELSDGRHKLVFLGDIINGECGYFSSYNSRAYKLLLGSILPWMGDGNIHYVIGNHDRDAKFYSTINGFRRDRVEKSLYCGGIFFQHGDMFDPLCNGKGLLGQLGSIASSAVVKFFPPDMEDLIRGRRFYYDHSDANKIRAGRSVAHSIEKTAIREQKGGDYNVARGALGLLKGERMKQDRERGRNRPCAIVCGHTHQTPVQIMDDSYVKLSYFNTGKFARDGFMVIKTRFSEAFGCWELV